MSGHAPSGPATLAAMLEGRRRDRARRTRCAGRRRGVALPGLAGEGVAAFATGVPDGAPLYLGLLLEGFYLAPRGMGAIPAIANETDIDELAAAIGRVLRLIGRIPEATGA
jgi:hypothetical protein